MSTTQQYQLFPDLAESDYAELKADIAERGVMVPLEYDEAGNLLDGHHRKRACEELGIKDFPSIVRYGMTESEKRQHIRKLNLARRHLTKEQRNQIIKDMRADGMSIPAIADAAHVGQGTVQRAVEGLPIGKGEITGKDGKTYPATKPRKPELYTQTEADLQRATDPEVSPRIASGKVKASNTLNIKRTHVENNSVENEWYTPPEWIEAAREVMGGIDLDPASSEKAQNQIRAKHYYTIDNDGLTKVWRGRIWLNPPYSRDLCVKFTERLLLYYEEGAIEQACLLTNNATETLWMQDVLRACSAACFPCGRISFLDRKGQPSNKPVQGQAVLYFGHRITNFREVFSKRGVILLGAGE